MKVWDCVGVIEEGWVDEEVGEGVTVVDGTPESVGKAVCVNEEDANDVDVIVGVFVHSGVGEEVDAFVK